MSDPYQRTFNEIERAFGETAKALSKQTKMIVWIAERTLSAKDFREFTEQFSEKTDSSEVMDFIKKEDRSKKNEPNG